MNAANKTREFIEAALPPHYNHREGGVEQAQVMLAADPALAAATFYTGFSTGD